MVAIEAVCALVQRSSPQQILGLPSRLQFTKVQAPLCQSPCHVNQQLPSQIAHVSPTATQN